MNRVLRRPMFRTGGSAEGITSGLDQTKLTASRPMYNRGRVVRPGGYRGDDTVGLALKHLDDPRIQELIGGQQESRFPEFLTSMGLDLLTRPKSGNIFQQVAASAKGPYSEWMGARADRGAREDKLKAALFGEFMDVETRKYEAEQKRLGLEADGTSDVKVYKGKFDLIEESIIELATLEKELNEAKKGTGAVEGVPGKIDPVPGKIDQDKIAGLATKIDAKKRALASLEDENPKLAAYYKSEAYESQINDLVDELTDTLGRTPTTKEVMDELNKGQKEGGRIGYQNAGAVMPNAMPSAMPAAMQAPGPADQGQDDTVQDLSFEELRSRLPQEITNDIVKLLSESKQALVDFANIRTQQDVNAFNQKYDVNLVVPQEV